MVVAPTVKVSATAVVRLLNETVKVEGLRVRPGMPVTDAVAVIWPAKPAEVTSRAPVPPVTVTKLVVPLPRAVERLLTATLMMEVPAAVTPLEKEKSPATRTRPARLAWKPRAFTAR